MVDPSKRPRIIPPRAVTSAERGQPDHVPATPAARADERAATVAGAGAHATVAEAVVAEPVDAHFPPTIFELPNRRNALRVVKDSPTESFMLRLL